MDKLCNTRSSLLAAVVLGAFFGMVKGFPLEKKGKILVLGHDAGSEWKHEAQNAHHLNLIRHHLCRKCG